MELELNIEKYVSALNNLIGTDYAYYIGDPDVDAIVEIIMLAKKLDERVKEMTKETCGNRSALTGGNYSTLTGGNYSALIGGDYSALTGGDRSVVYGGEGAKVRAGKGSVLALQYLKMGRIVGIKFKEVDGEKIKTDTWYKLDKAGNFIEERTARRRKDET